MYFNSKIPAKHLVRRVCHAPTGIAGIKLLHIFSLVALFAFGAAVGVSLWYGFASVQYGQRSAAFTSRASSITFLLQTLIDQGITEAQSFANVLAMYPTYNITKLNSYVKMVQPSSVNQPDMITLLYLPLVRYDDVDDFIDIVRVYNPSFAEDGVEAERFAAKNGSDLFPVYYVSDEEKNVGPDLYNFSAVAHQPEIDMAINMSKLIVGSPTYIDNQYVNEIVLFLPLKNENQGLVGMALGVVNASMMLDIVMSSVPDADQLDIHMFFGQNDLTDPLNGPPPQERGPGAMQPVNGLLHTSYLNGPGFNWTLVFTPLSSFETKYDSVWAIILMAVISLFVLIIAAFCFVEVRNHGKFKKLTRKNVMLLNKILPPAISKRLGKGETFIADHRENTSILFMDISGFTEFSSNNSAAEVVGLLDEMFSRLDTISADYQVEKIKTIGDSYMAVTGIFDLPYETAQTNAERMVGFALEAVQAVNVLFKAKPATSHLSVRIGVHSGPLVAGVTGHTRPHFDIWGDSVNVASRMESTGVPNHVHISEQTHALVHDAYECAKRPETVYAKGKGNLQTYLVVQKKTVAAHATLDVRSAVGAFSPMSLLTPGTP